MKTPFEILELDESAEDEAIKKAYLAKVRDFPPERDGQAFQLIRQAYECIQTEKERIRYKLFNRDIPDVSLLTAKALLAKDIQRPDSRIMTAALAEAAISGFLKNMKQE